MAGVVARSAADGPSADDLLTIGRVLDLLRADFDVSITKIRYLEDVGLVLPQRTAAGYRMYSHDDVERLRYVLRMQRDHYLPLKVIGEHLDAMARGEQPPPPDPLVPTVPVVARGADGLPGPESFRRRDNLRLSRRELVKTAGIDDALLGELEKFGLVTPSRSGHYDTDALLVAHTARELADYGIEPRHLRGFKAAADREVGLVEQVVAPARRSRAAGASARAEEQAAELAALTVRLHATLVKIGLGSR